MLTVWEPCDSEYRVRALLLRPRQGVTSLLIGDIRVPAAASYPQFRSLLLLLLFNLFTPTPLPTSTLHPLLLILSPSLAPHRWDLLSLAVGSPPTSPHRHHQQHTPPTPPLVCISSGGAVQEQPHVTVRRREEEGGEASESRRRRKQLMLHHAATSRHLGAASFLFFSHPSLSPSFFCSPHEHQRVINRINLGPNFLMIAVLMYVNECSLLTHYRQFA